ncbi:thermonuclease family protein [Dongia rigui]|uniref:Thermonuclease family protein n=1 Tax=Dongia rigui TaxID=940149 RepID=A0ABU5E5X3_9PROT|nr:thermonuclease family protein [Dongia rigui]MDY0874353.1 thermonuclease family protein [Dongia rigui]
MKIKIGLAAALLTAAFLIPAEAKTKNPLQPPPPAVPVGNVEAQPLDAPTPPTLEGTGQAIDGDEIAIGDVIFKLDGIAAPLMTVPMGPEARVALQALIDGQRLTCDVLDRGEDARHLSGVCRIGKDDVAEAMLAGGMAAVYRQTNSQNADQRERAARYDAAETEARGRNSGIWTKPAAEDVEIEQAPAAPEPAMDKDLLRGWLIQIPIIAFLALAGLTALVVSTQRNRAERKAAEADMQALLAILLGEVLSVRAAAQAAFDGTASLIQDLPIPTAQLASLALPPMTVFEANADKLASLPREVSVDMVQFHARHQIVGKVLAQASTLRCEQLRAAFEALVQAADEPMNRAEKLLD